MPPRTRVSPNPGPYATATQGLPKHCPSHHRQPCRSTQHNIKGQWINMCSKKLQQDGWAEFSSLLWSSSSSMVHHVDMQLMFSLVLPTMMASLHHQHNHHQHNHHQHQSPSPSPPASSTCYHHFTVVTTLNIVVTIAIVTVVIIITIISSMSTIIIFSKVQHHDNLLCGHRRPPRRHRHCHHRVDHDPHRN